MVIKAFGYLRTSSATNVGDDKDTEKRQRAAIEQWAAANGYKHVGWFYDANVKGAEPVHLRPGFADMLAAIAGNGVRVVLVETANRFARDLIIQETGRAYLKELGITLIPVDAPDHFNEETPTSTMIRQILGAVSQFERASLVAKLAGARRRIRREVGRCEGPKPAPEAARTMAKALRGQRHSLRAIAATLAQNGFLSPSGKPYGAESVKRMLK
jgi:DNA invertase Pin-like site-specific DNA recombinase